MSARRRRVLLREGEDGSLCGVLSLRGETANDLDRHEKRKWDQFKQANRDRTAESRKLDILDDGNKDFRC